jgi:hypothetical protein
LRRPADDVGSAVSLTVIDLYCERVGPGFWAEPINALSNLAYVAASWAVWRAFAGTPVRVIALRLTVLIGAIGAGSALFHTVATPWARRFDEVPILVFELVFLWEYGRRVLRLRPTAVMLLSGALLAAVFAARQFSDVLNGSLVYLPALFAVTAFGISSRRAHGARTLLSAAAVLAAAVVFRTIDQQVCHAVPAGTHFLWHLLTAVVLYLCSRGLLVDLK